MKTESLQMLKTNFVDKICTVLTQSVNKSNFNDQQFSEFFTGMVTSINEDGLILVHHLTKCKSFFAMEHIVAILEEQVIDESSPFYDDIVKQVEVLPEEEKANIQKITPNDSPYIDPVMLAAMAKKAQEQKRMVQKSN